MLFRNVIIRIIFLFLLTSSLSAGEIDTDRSHPFYLLKAGEKKLSASTGFLLEEHEYEKASSVQDLFEYQHWIHEVEGAIGFSGERLAGASLSFLSHGKVSKSYSPLLNISDESVRYQGLYALELYYQEHFKTQSSKNKMALEIRFKGSPIRGKESNNTYSGKDASLGLLYSHRHEDWRIYGDIHAEIIGRRKTRKSNGEMETFNAYSQFGTLLGAQWLREKFWVEGNALFYLTTDYNSHSPSYTRLTDKGFVVGGKFLVGFFLNEKSYLTLEHVRSGSNFNVITESNDDSTEFEIENQYSRLGVTWFF